MKKKLLVAIPLSLMLLTGVACSAKMVAVKAEDSEITEPEVEEDEPTEEELIEKIKEWMSKYLEQSTVEKIITWAVDAGVLSSLFVIYLKYRKYKHNTVEEVLTAVKKEVGKYLEDCFAKLDKEAIQKIIDSFKEVEANMELLMKALVLSQSKTSESKVAMLDLISGINKNAEINKTIDEVKTEIIKEKQAEEAVKEVVKNEYHPVD